MLLALMTPIILTAQSGDCVIEVTGTDPAGTRLINVRDINYIRSATSGCVLFRGANATDAFPVSEPIDTIISRCQNNLFKFTNADDGVTMAVSKPFVKDVLMKSDSTVLILSSLPRFRFETTEKWADLYDLITACSVSGSGGVSLDFDGDRQILRVPEAGDNLGTATVTDWLEWWYFTAPTGSLARSPTTDVYEIGDSVDITFTLTVTNDGGATLSNGSLFVVSPSTELDNFGAGTSSSAVIPYSPLQTPSGLYTAPQYQVRATQDWSFGSESGTMTSNTRTIRGVYPVFYGVSATDFGSAGNIYTDADMEKNVSVEGDKIFDFTGTGFLYMAIPASWSDNVFDTILEGNDFPVDIANTFDILDINISSTGLTNDWTAVPYKVYKAKVSATYNNTEYEFYQ